MSQPVNHLSITAAYALSPEVQRACLEMIRQLMPPVRVCTLDADASQAEINTLKQQNTDLTTSRDQLQKTITDLKTELKTSQQKNQQLDSELAEQQQRQHLLQEEMIKAEAQIELIKELLLREYPDNGNSNH